MKPEAADYLGKARQCLDEAKQISALIPLHHIVGREAYLAAYHAAGAYIFERTGKTVKTHRGLRSEFSRLARRVTHWPRVPDLPCRSLRVQINRGLRRRLDIAPITAEDAHSAIDSAGRLIDCIAELLG